MQGIVIQGPTQFYKEVADSWSGWPNVVWSTWENEPTENIEYIQSKGINVLLSKPPLFAGHINVNYQALSTFNGLQFLQERGVTEVLKIRSDHIVSNIKSLLEILYGRQMSFMVLSNVDVRRDIKYNLGYTHYGHDYPSDNVVYGKMDDMLKMWDFQTDKTHHAPPEALILYNYLVAKNIPVDFTFEHLLRNNISFFLRDCVDKNITIKWLKKNQELTNLYNNGYYKF